MENENVDYSDTFSQSLAFDVDPKGSFGLATFDQMGCAQAFVRSDFHCM